MALNNKRSSRQGQSDLCAVPCFNLDVVRRLRASLPAEAALQESQALFAALADRTRLKIFHALRDGEELCVCDVAHVLGTSVATASHHLRKLRDLALLQYRNDGKMTYYSIRNPVASELVARTLGHPLPVEGVRHGAGQAPVAGARRRAP